VNCALLSSPRHKPLTQHPTDTSACVLPSSADVNVSR